MTFSKSFGYAVRVILHLCALPENQRTRVEEVARHLGAPKHFLGKVMKALVKNDILSSSKGPSGGFCITDRTMNTSLLQLLEQTDGLDAFNQCVLHFSKCNSKRPCYMHPVIEENRKELKEILGKTKIRQLLEMRDRRILTSILPG
jgi:Rrf2 family protein